MFLIRKKSRQIASHHCCMMIKTREHARDTKTTMKRVRKLCHKHESTFKWCDALEAEFFFRRSLVTTLIKRFKTKIRTDSRRLKSKWRRVVNTLWNCRVIFFSRKIIITRIHISILQLTVVSFKSNANDSLDVWKMMVEIFPISLLLKLYILHHN